MRPNPRFSHQIWTILLLAASPAMLVANSAQAAEKSGSVPSLDIVPEDAVFYSATLRSREQWDAMVNSKAWNKLKEMPLVQMGLGGYAMLAADPNSVPGKIKLALRVPELRKPLDLLIDMMSDEVFVYGDYSMIENMKVNAGQPVKVQVPELVMGFHVKNHDLAKEMLDRLFEMGSAAANDDPRFKDRMKKETVDGHEYITLNVDGGMIPWDELKLDDIRKSAGDPEQFDKLIDHVKEMKAVASLGLRDDYIILAIGPSTDVLTHIGHGKSLHSRKEFAKMAKYEDKPILNVGYVSEAFQRATAMKKDDVDQIQTALKPYLTAAKVPAAMKNDIERDVAKLAKDMKAAVHEMGASLSFSYRVDGGQAGLSYDWSEHPEIDGSKPLSLLHHVGGSPIAAAVTRGKYDPAAYDLFVKWVGVGYGYFEKYGLPEMKESEQTEYKDFAAKMMPLVKQISDVTREKFLPSLADSQAGVVLDAKLTSKQFVQAMPETPKEMPMLEPALVLGVSDAAMLRKAMGEYYDLADKCIDVVRTLKDSKIPEDFKLPRPTASTVSSGTVFGYAIPEACGVDSQVLPNAALSEHVAVLSMSQKHSERLLASADPEMSGRKIPIDRPLAAAAGFDHAAFIDAITPWIDYGMDIGLKEAPNLPLDADSLREQVHTVLDVLKVYRGIVSITYFEDKVLVSRWHSEFRDLTE